MTVKRIVTTVGVAALLAAPATATAAKPTPTATKGQGKAKAYGKYCQGESKKRVEGEKGTAFSRCVNAMAKAQAEGRKPKKPKLQTDKEEQDSEAATS